MSALPWSMAGGSNLTLLFSFGRDKKKEKMWITMVRGKLVQGLNVSAKNVLIKAYLRSKKVSIALR